MPLYYSTHQSEIAPLRLVSARLGTDPLLVQAGTGNTSIKLGNTLWIKASGKWLMNATNEDQFVPVDLARARDCLRRGLEVTQECVVAPHDLKPSIETAMHSVIPDSVVLHVHSVNTIAWAVRKDGSTAVRDNLTGLRWQWIPYALSGRALACEVEKALRRAPGTRVFILANHGLVVSGQSPEAAESLLRQVEQRLNIDPRPTPPSRIAMLMNSCCGSPWRFPDSADLHALGTDAASRNIVSRGILYPCQAIFFGSKPAIAPIDTWLQTARGSFTIIEGAGVVINRTATKTEYAMLCGLRDVVQRVDPESQVAYLKSQEVKRVLATEGSIYRSRMNAESAGLVHW